VCTGFWWGNLRKGTTGETRVKWEDNITMYLQELRCGVWTALSLLKIETDGGHL
jgi:hypothetical protein